MPIPKSAIEPSEGDMTTLAKQERSNKLELFFDLLKTYLMGRGVYKYAATLITTGTALVGPTEPFAYSLIRVLAHYIFPASPNPLIALEQNNVQWLGIVMIIVGLIIGTWDYISSKIKPVRQLLVQYSYQRIFHRPLKEAIDPTRKYWIVSFVMDLQNIRNANKDKLKKIHQSVLRKVNRIKDSREVDYCGIAHIPIVAYTGFLLKNQSVRFLEIQHSTRKPIVLEKGKNQSLTFQKDQIEKSNDTEIAISVSVSFKIVDSKIQSAIGKRIRIQHLELEKNSLSNINSEDDINQLGKEFRTYLCKIHQCYTSLEKVHLFYAGQTSLIFRLGQLISENTDQEIIVYHHDKKLGYIWGTSINNGGNIVQLS